MQVTFQAKPFLLLLDLKCCFHPMLTKAPMNSCAFLYGHQKCQNSHMWYFLLEVLDCVAPYLKLDHAAKLHLVFALSIKATVIDINVVTGKVNESIGNKIGRNNCSIDRVH